MFMITQILYLEIGYLETKRLNLRSLLLNIINFFIQNFDILILVAKTNIYQNMPFKLTLFLKRIFLSQFNQMFQINQTSPDLSQQQQMALLHQSSHHTAFLSVNINAQPEQKFKKIIQKMNKKKVYQYLIIGFIIPIYFLIVFNTMIGPFVFMNPLFQCSGQSSNQEEACEQLSKCKISNDFTAAFKAQLYCQKQPIRSTIQSIFGLGYIIGKLTFPVLCDTIGRKNCMRIAMFMGIIAMTILLLSIQYNNQVFMVIGQLSAGVFGSGIAIISFIYVCDFCVDKIRQFCLTTCWAVWGLAQMFFYILYQYIPGWRFYLTATLYVPITIIFVFLLFFMLQSPVFALFVQKNPKKFDQIVDQLSKFNNFSQQSKASLKQQGRIITTLLKKGKQSEIHLKQILTKIFCEVKNLKIVLCLILSNLSYIFFYYGMQGSMETVGLSFGVNMFFVGLVQFVSFATVGYVTRRMKRKLGLIISMVLSSVIGLSFLLDFVKNNQGLQTVFVVIIRVTLSYFFCFFVLMESQSLQVQIRNTSFALIQGSGQIGRIAAPYVINIMYNLKIAPIIIFSAFFLILGALPSFILKQTYKKPEEKKSQYENSKYEAQKSEASIDRKLVDN